MKAIFEDAVAQSRFSMSKVYQAVFEQFFSQSEQVYKNEFDYVEQKLGKSTTRKVFQGLLRFAFFIEPVKKPKIDSTKYAVRWGHELDKTDPRYATFDTCIAIFNRLVNELTESCEEDDKRDLLRFFTDHSLIAYELPTDYIERKIFEPIHTPQNITFFWDELPQNVIKLRTYLLDKRKYRFVKFFNATYGKIIVKACLTDRVLTGEHKTNREKRWETHPASVHFSLRRDSLGIEMALINQLCYFDGFPAQLQKELEQAGLISFQKTQDSILTNSVTQVSRCPITLEPLSFEEFQREIFTPRHGRASYQVGHMHPLKALADNPHTGHTAKNISWISSQGNRIQGEYSVEETREVLLRIIENYKAVGLVE